MTRSVFIKTACAGMFSFLLSGNPVLAYEAETEETEEESGIDSGALQAPDTPQIDEIFTDQASYDPEAAVMVYIRLANDTAADFTEITVTLQAWHLNEKCGAALCQTLDLKAGAEMELTVKWEAPAQDYTGYLLEIILSDSDTTVLDMKSVAVDISSDWRKFPRYGYLSDFGKNADTEDTISQLNKYHINVLEFYDWQYLHHEPLSPAIAAGEDRYQDWSGRRIFVDTLKAYLANAHRANMICMAYDMIYAGTDSFMTDDDGNPSEATTWQIQFAPDNDRGEGFFTYYMGYSPSGNGTLYFMNPLNASWQNYIFGKFNEVFSALDFDGWHGDTVGEWGKMVTAEGNPLGYEEDGTPIYLVQDTYTQFLNAAKAAIGDHYLSFNPVGAQGIENVNISDTDVLYTEFWPWDSDRNGELYDTYASLVHEIERSIEDSADKSADGKGKSLTTKAYINYAKTLGYMNTPGVLLCDAAVYAAGGNRLELGDSGYMLHTEYYPSDEEVLMNEELKSRMRNMMDFVVAYENLLRDGQRTSEHLVKIDGYETSSEGLSDKIWTYTKEDETHEILHLINLIGNDNLWRDEEETKAVPETLENLKVRFYTDRSIQNVTLASPDLFHSMSTDLSFEKGADESGNYVTFTVSSLEYWDMIYFM